jgi:hypothetical protein
MFGVASLSRNDAEIGLSEKIYTSVAVSLKLYLARGDTNVVLRNGTPPRRPWKDKKQGLPSPYIAKNYLSH